MLSVACFSDKGDREVNEDAIKWAGGPAGSLFVLCDGLGGHGMGDVASDLVTRKFCELFAGCATPRGFLEDAFPAAQDKLMAEQRRRGASKKMKTTAAALLLDDKKAYIGHVGDSRVYVFRKGGVLCRTKDHSIPQMLALSGDIKESEIRFHPERNIVLRVMGVEWEEPPFELEKPLRLKRGDAFLLCSDGFWELIVEDKMCGYLARSGTADAWLTAMKEEVRRNGAGRNMDNFSAIAILNQ